MSRATTLAAVPLTAAGRLWRAGVLALVGAALVFITGFAHPDALHNAAHDARHANNFPCH